MRFLFKFARFSTVTSHKKTSVLALVAALGAIGLTSCGPSYCPLPSHAIQARGLKPGEGYVVGAFHMVSVDRTGNKYPSGATTTVTARGASNANKDSTVTFMPLPDNLKDLFSKNPNPDELVAIPLPAGDYEITRWNITGPAVTATVTVSNRLPMKVPFQVRAGEATYVGRINVLTITGKNILGMPVFGDGVVLITDEFEKDQPRIARKYTSIRASSIRRSEVPKLYKAEMKRIVGTPRPWWQ